MDEKFELEKMTDEELRAYNRICKMGLKCISSKEDRELNKRHLEITNEILRARGLVHTVESVKRDLPTVRVRWHGKLYFGRVTGRLNKFASVYPWQEIKSGSVHTFAGPIYEFAWETIVNSLNNGKALIID